jgi:hypothetical protein
MHRSGTLTMTPVNHIENRTYDEIQVGDTATLARPLRPQDGTLAFDNAVSIVLAAPTAPRRAPLPAPLHC